jgi:hypothetical protein
MRKRIGIYRAAEEARQLRTRNSGRHAVDCAPSLVLR